MAWVLQQRTGRHALTMASEAAGVLGANGASPKCENPLVCPAAPTHFFPPLEWLYTSPLTYVQFDAHDRAYLAAERVPQRPIYTAYRYMANQAISPRLQIAVFVQPIWRRACFGASSTTEDDWTGIFFKLRPTFPPVGRCRTWERKQAMPERSISQIDRRGPTFRDAETVSDRAQESALCGEYARTQCFAAIRSLRCLAWLLYLRMLQRNSGMYQPIVVGLGSRDCRG